MSQPSRSGRPPFQEVGPESPEDRFRRFDRDESGDVSWEEVVAVYRKLGRRVDQELLRERFEQTDRNNNGILEPAEADASLAE
jgi:Ca2+-binding EF-hand superfamily protein